MFSSGVESDPGRGSRFWVGFPSCAVAAVPAPLSAAGAAQHTLLYVEDNPANLLLIEQLMERRQEFKLLTAIDAHLGISLARACRPSVILMDIKLPTLSGFGALRMLREFPGTAHIPVLVLALSANAMPRDIERGLEAGLFRYLTKPLVIAEFMEALDLALLHAQEHGNDPVPGVLV